jgi:hypothetical protein
VDSRKTNGNPFVTIAFVDATTSFARLDGVAWDGNAEVSPAALTDLRLALVKRSPYAATLEVIGAHDGEPWGKPDPFGTVSLLGATCADPIRALPLRRDTYRPSWAPGIKWPHVALDPGVRLRVVLEDDDTPNPNELIGGVDITYEMITSALAENGAVHHVDVSAQKQPILFVGISVIAE